LAESHIQRCGWDEVAFGQIVVIVQTPAAMSQATMKEAFGHDDDDVGVIVVAMRITEKIECGS
jgi:hypothetical protein